MCDIRPSLFYNENDYSIFDRMSDEDDASSTLRLLNADNTVDRFPMVMRTEEVDGAFVSFPLSYTDKVKYYEDNGPLVLDFQRNLIQDLNISPDIMSLSKNCLSARFLGQSLENGYDIPENAYQVFDLAHLLSQLGYNYSDCLAFSFGASHVIIYLVEGGYKAVLYTDIWEYFDDMWSDVPAHPDEILKEHLENSFCDDPCISIIDGIDTLTEFSSSAVTAVYITVVGHPSIFEIEYPFVNFSLVSDLLDYSESRLGVSCSLWYSHKYTGFKFHPDMNVNFLHKNLFLYVDQLEPNIIKRYPKHFSSAQLLGSCYWKNDYIFVLPRRHRPLASRFYCEAFHHCVAYIDKYVGVMGMPSIDRFFLSAHKAPDIRGRSGDRSLTHEQWMLDNFNDYHGNNVSVDSEFAWSSFFGSWIPVGRFFLKILPGSYLIDGRRTLSGSICVCMVSRLGTYMVLMSKSGYARRNFDPGSVYNFMSVFLGSKCYGYLSYSMERGTFLYSCVVRGYS